MCTGWCNPNPSFLSHTWHLKVATAHVLIESLTCSPNPSFSGASGMQRPSSSSAMQNGYAEPQQAHTHQTQDSIWSGAVAAASNSFSSQSRAHPSPSPPPMRPAEPSKPKPDLDVSTSPQQGAASGSAIFYCQELSITMWQPLSLSFPPRVQSICWSVDRWPNPQGSSMLSHDAAAALSWKACTCRMSNSSLSVAGSCP